MEWPPLVRLYESRLWRRSALFTAVLGISFERECELIVDAANSRPDDVVLDLACGPGIYTRSWARRVPRGRIVGLDLSVPMLRYAGERVRAEGLANVDLVRGDATRLPFRDGAFASVNCCGALHLFPDPERAVAEIARVLAPGGTVTLAVFRHADSRAGRLRADIRRTLWGLGSFSREGLATMLGRAGFQVPTELHAASVWLVVAATKSRA
jgi:SAM-dependent methyltransferase